MRGALLQSRGRDPGVAGIFAEGLERRRSEIAHAALEAAGQLREDGIGGSGNFLQRLDPLGGGLPLGVKNAMKYFEPELKAYFA